MSLAIRLATSVSPQRLRDLVVDNLTQMLGEGTRPWDDMPGMDDGCLGAVDAHNELVLVSFDGEDASRALLNGLTCMEALSSELATQLLSPYRKPARLLVLAPTPPPGASLLQGSGALEWMTFQVLSVNGEFGLLLEAGAPRQRTLWVPRTPGPAETAPAPGEEELIQLA